MLCSFEADGIRIRWNINVFLYPMLSGNAQLGLYIRCLKPYAWAWLSFL